VTNWELIFLGVMAVALAVMALGQVILALAVVKTARQVATSVSELQRDMRPLIEKATRVAEDASRVTALAVVQAERIDMLVKTTTARVDETFSLVQSAVVEPLRQGTAVLAAVRAAVAAIRAWQRPPASAAAGIREDEDPLFVG
jgi:hypothetical protein